MHQPTMYYQYDPRWCDIPYASKGEQTTIGTSGCGPTVMAMVLATWVDPNITPQTEASWALSNGYKEFHKGTNYGYFEESAKRFNIECKKLNQYSIYDKYNSWFHDIMKDELQEGNLVIACMGKGAWTQSGHFVLVYDINEEENLIFINDPASAAIYRCRGNLRIFKQQVKYYWVLKKPSNM